MCVFVNVCACVCMFSPTRLLFNLSLFSRVNSNIGFQTSNLSGRTKTMIQGDGNNNKR